jgi:hypothetical protein
LHFNFEPDDENNGTIGDEIPSQEHPQKCAKNNNNNSSSASSADEYTTAASSAIVEPDEGGLRIGVGISLDKERE